MEVSAVKCDKCGKAVLCESSSDSSDMIQANGEFLFLGDLQKLESFRPHLALCDIQKAKPHYYCPDCLIAVITEWVDKIKLRKPSKILASNVLLPRKK